MTFTKPILHISLLLLLSSVPLAAHDIFELESMIVQGRESNLIGESISASEGHVSQVDLEYRPLQRTGVTALLYVCAHVTLIYNSNSPI